MLCGVTATQGSNPCATAFRLVAPTDVGATSFLLGRLLRGWVEWAWPGTFGLLRELFDSFGLKDEKSWSEPDLSALWCGKVWFKVVGGQL